MEILKINRWPASQVCIECVYGEFFESDTYCSSDFICQHPFKDVQDEDCPHQKRVVCFYCGYDDEVKPDNFNKLWCGECERTEDFGDKADRLYEQANDV